MHLFNIIFAFGMILVPPLTVAFVPINRKSTTVDLPRARTLTAVLWLLTIVALALWWIAYRNTGSAWWPWQGSIVIASFFGLFFGLTMPILRLKNPDWSGTPPHDLPVRAAALRPRSELSPILRRALHLLWLVWAIGLGFVLLGLDWSVLSSTVNETTAGRRNMAIGAIFSIGSLIVIPISMSFAVRLDRHEPQPLDPSGSAELKALYECRRRQRAWLLIGMGYAMLIVFIILAGGMALISRGVWPEAFANQALAWFGVTAGVAIGVGGGVFGTLSSIQAARINARLRELTE